MKKVAYILVGLLMFVIGIFCNYFRPIAMPISLCEASQNHALYQFTDIWVKADLSANKDHSVLFISEANKVCEESGADLTFSNDYDESELITKQKLNSEFSELKAKSIELNSESTMVFADVLVKGRLVKRTMNCFAAPFYFEVKEIRQVSPVRIVELREYWSKAASE
jgi:hypothetical protein